LASISLKIETFEKIHTKSFEAKPQFSSTGLRLALILIYPASGRPAGRPRLVVKYLEMSKTRPSNHTGKYKDPNWKMTSFFLQMEDDLNFLENGRRHSLFGKIEDGLNIKGD
jgi:hypothetical protein